jgi:hypothetical protein
MFCREDDMLSLRKCNIDSLVWVPLFLLILLARLSASTVGPNDYLLLQRPALSQTQIVFVYAGDLWSVPREGGRRSG